MLVPEWQRDKKDGQLGCKRLLTSESQSLSHTCFTDGPGRKIGQEVPVLF